MALETGNYVGDLVITNPTPSDQKSAGDDHLRLIKTALKTSFAGFTGSILLTGSDTGGVNNYALTPTPALPAYVTGMMVLFNPSATNTTTSTINVSALGAKTIKTVDGAALTAGDFVTGVYHLLIYDGTDFRLVGLTKNYADNLSFSSSLPSQTGNGGKYITTDGATASWADPYASAPLTGTPTAPTAATATNTTQIATTEFVKNQAYATLASPTLTGTPIAPTGAADITTGQIINAAWYNGQKGTDAPQAHGSATAGTSKKWSPIDHVHPSDAPIAATGGEVTTGTNTTKFVSPSTMVSHKGVAKAWCKATFSGTINDSYNVSSVTDVAVGYIAFNYATAMGSTHYSVALSCKISSNDSRMIYTTDQLPGLCNAKLWTGSALVDPDNWFMTAHAI